MQPPQKNYPEAPRMMHPQQGYITSLSLMTFYLLTRNLSQDTSRLTEVHFILRMVGTCCLVPPPSEMRTYESHFGSEVTTCQQIQGNVCRNLRLPMICHFLVQCHLSWGGGGTEVGLVFRLPIEVKSQKAAGRGGFSKKGSFFN